MLRPQCCDRPIYMRGTDHQQADMYSYLSPEMRVRPDHPLRAIRAMSDKAVSQMSVRFDEMYAKAGRPSIAPESSCVFPTDSVEIRLRIRCESIVFPQPASATPVTRAGGPASYWRAVAASSARYRSRCASGSAWDSASIRIR